MKILTVSHFFESHGGGIERVAMKLNGEFIRAGHHAIWAASSADAAPGGEIDAVPLGCVNPTEALTGLPMPIPGPRAVFALSRAIRRSDAVVIHDALYVTSILAMILAKFHRKPVALIQHIANIPFANAMMRRAMRVANACVTQPMLRGADSLIFISDIVRRDLIGEPATRPFNLLFNGVDTAIFRPRPEMPSASVRGCYTLPAGAPLAIFVGRFVTKKGLSILEALARRRGDVHFALVGSGPVDPTAWQLSNVHVLGPLPQESIAELYRSADMLLLPSVGEGYPLVIQEAMACGLPVICGAESARADPAASEWLHGVAIDLGDPAESASRCAERMDYLKAHLTDSSAMARYASDRYNWEKMAGRIVDLLADKTK